MCRVPATMHGCYTGAMHISRRQIKSNEGRPVLWQGRGDGKGSGRLSTSSASFFFGTCFGRGFGKAIDAVETMIPLCRVKSGARRGAARVKDEHTER